MGDISIIARRLEMAMSNMGGAEMGDILQW